MSGGRPPVNEFHIDIHDEASGAHVRIFMSPEEFALSMWGRGDIVVKAEWTGVEFGTEECGVHGCRKLKPRGNIMCEGCKNEYHEDPDAFK